MRGSRRGDGAPRPVTVRHELSQWRARRVAARDWPWTRRSRRNALFGQRLRHRAPACRADLAPRRGACLCSAQRDRVLRPTARPRDTADHRGEPGASAATTGLWTEAIANRWRCSDV